ncbi:hypothetical protein N665_1097s0006 [Sinapis alba]|nr:hypothetical protein N665_1097s0006 [Sinapis alba]
MGPEIFEAIRNNDEATFDHLAQETPAVLEERDMKNHGESVLHLVTKLGHKRFAKKIIASCPSLDDLELDELVNNKGLTPLHCAVISGSVKILEVFHHKTPSSFRVLTVPKKETVFHLAVIHQKIDAFQFMAREVELEKLLHQRDIDGNTPLHTAASLGSTLFRKLRTCEKKLGNRLSIPGYVIFRLSSTVYNKLLIYKLSYLVDFIMAETKINAKAKNREGHTAAHLLNKNDANFPKLSISLTFGEGRRKEEALQNARNTITVVAVLIASITFASGINPPGGVYQEGDMKGTAIAGNTLAFKVFSVSNIVALFTSVLIVILLVSIIPYKMKPFKKLLVITHTMMSFALTAMSASYVAAGWVILPHFDGTSWLLYAALAIAIVMLGGIYVYLWFQLAIYIVRKMDTERIPDEEAASNNGNQFYWTSNS